MDEYGPSGGPGGDTFIDQIVLNKVDIHIAKVDIWWGAEVDSIQVYYRDSSGNTYTGKRYGTNNGSHKDTFDIPKDEFLTQIYGLSGHRVDTIAFVTTKGNSPGSNSNLFGDGGGGKDYLYAAESGFEIIGFKGRSGDSIDAISIHTRPHRT